MNFDNRGPHRLAHNPPRPREYPRRPAGRPYHLRRWVVELVRRGGTEQEQHDD